MTQNNSTNNGTPDNAAFKVGGQSPITFDRFIRGLIGLLLIVGFGTALYYLSGVLIPFFVAWMVAYLLYPVVRFLQNKCRLRNRLLAIIITLLLTCGAIAGFIYIVVPPMIEEIGHPKDVALSYIQGASTTASYLCPCSNFCTATSTSTK